MTTSVKEEKAFRWIHTYHTEEGTACGECEYQCTEYEDGFRKHSECEVNNAEDCPMLPDNLKTVTK